MRSTGPPCFFAQKSGIGVAARLIAGNPMILEILAPDNPNWALRLKVHFESCIQVSHRPMIFCRFGIKSPFGSGYSSKRHANPAILLAIFFLEYLSKFITIMKLNTILNHTWRTISGIN